MRFDEIDEGVGMGLRSGNGGHTRARLQKKGFKGLMFMLVRKEGLHACYRPCSSTDQQS